jgi:hypothetical protein
VKHGTELGLGPGLEGFLKKKSEVWGDIPVAVVFLNV